MAIARIKFTQGALNPPAGEALIGVAAAQVDVSNGDDSGIQAWEWSLEDVPDGSSVTEGLFSSSPSGDFTPDVPGGYLVLLEVTDNEGRKVQDRRVFQVPENVDEDIIPPFLGAATSMNFGADSGYSSPNIKGWAKAVEKLLRKVATGGGSGISAFTQTTASFTMPAVNSNVAVSVAESSWMVPTEVVYVSTAGYMQVVSVGSGTVTLKNLGYSGNASPGASIPSSSTVGAGGLKGTDGANGSNGTNGTNGVNAFTTTTATFTQPAVNSNVAVSVSESSWMVVDEVVYVETAGYMQVVSTGAGTATLKNLGYTGNASPSTSITSPKQVGAGGLKGTDGANGSNGSNGTNGTNGTDAFTTTTADFTMPAINSNVAVSVVTSAWMSVGQVVYVATAGYMSVVSTGSGTATLKNLGYTGNAASSTNIAQPQTVSPAGLLGPGATRGAYASAPAAGVAGALYFATDAPLFAHDDGSSLAWYQIGTMPLVATPAISGFTAYNAGGRTTTSTDSFGGIYMVATDGTSANDLRLRTKSQSFASQKTFTVHLVPNMGDRHYGGCGIALRASGSGNVIVFGVLNETDSGFAGPILYCTLYTASGTGGSPTYTQSTQYLSSGSVAYAMQSHSTGGLWLRVKDDSTTNRTWSFSFDGMHYIDILVHGRTTGITPDEIGLWIAPTVIAGTGVQVGCWFNSYEVT